MHDAADAPGRYAVFVQNAIDARDHAARRIVMCRQNLAAEPAAFPMVVDDDVGEGAADIDAQREAAVGSVRHGVRYLPFSPFSFPFVPFPEGPGAAAGTGESGSVQHCATLFAMCCTGGGGLRRVGSGSRRVPFHSLSFLFVP